jgi:hypothetical protein
MQMVTFILTGLLTFAFAIGLWRVLRPSGAVWGPGLIALVGLGLMGAGLFVTDSLNGYPPGTPVLPTERTIPGILHDLFSVPFFLGLPITGLAFARYFARMGQHGWAAYSAISGVAMFAVFFVARLGLRPGFEDLAGLFGLFQRITVTIGWAWLTLLAVYMQRVLLETSNAVGHRT